MAFWVRFLRLQNTPNFANFEVEFRYKLSLNALTRLSVGKDGDNKMAHAGTNVQVGALVCGV